MTEQAFISVLGGGSFGTAIANIAAENGNRVRQWMRDPERAAEVNQLHENTRYMPGYSLHENLIASTEIKEISDAEIIFFSIPSKSFPQVVDQVRPYISKHQMLVSTTKGIQGDGFRLMSQVLADAFPDNPIGVISGPNLAKEIGQHQLTATVIASASNQVRTRLQEVLGCRYFRVYANSDVFGVELGGALKNIYAIASGMAASLGMGENTKAMLITRSLAEMSRFAEALGANPYTFLGLAGVGDLIVTCTSSLSRNYRVGYAVAKGEAIEEAVDDLGEVAEGINTLKIVKDKAEEMGIYMPLVSGLHGLLYEKKELSEVIDELMLAEQSTDVDFVLSREEHLKHHE
ncbi:glycerol-3-phosphate dehydrogenase [Oleiphilus messinensis]|uniref:Glycerol-3-phosphate dehydrogenase [NAD(P)+] n=1 Tax=Oleiphilus messinensis TaxID=141451 RepID=A0A1Y0I8U7_9GAMM|nr:NAD(P)H-dependent glycerol-3-phosphate dehydrogenase [Oleiphilus messinensis]ARU56937.1 glycerol-3-phosphate dehydrogenase [Oleiphilus messinensis]